jgi:hypothetical protein
MIGRFPVYTKVIYQLMQHFVLRVDFLSVSMSWPPGILIRFVC